MSKRRRKNQMFDEPVFEAAIDDYEAPKTKRPKGKSWGKARRSNQKSAYWDN